MPERRRQHLGAVPKIGDVARAAGVSPATVSRVMNGTGTVAPERAAAVHRAARELGYTPSGPARALRQQKARVWAAIIADIENPFFTAMVRGIEDVARSVGHRLVLCNSDEDLDKETAYLDIVLAEQMAGVVIAVASDKESRLDGLLDRGVPVVAVDRRPRHRVDELDSVVVDNVLGARLATEHLMDAGAQRIACVTGPSRVSTARERLSGYQQALRARGRPAPGGLVRRADFKEAGGYAATRALLAMRPRPDALFAANNLMTLGALRALREAGLRVPDDVLLVGFDDAPWTTLVSPPLTVMTQPTYEIGRQAAQLLTTASPDLPARHIVLPPALQERASSLR
ncbi:MAG: substrate-binding domain-containing protein [Acidimicrobiales bacterium]